MPKYRRKPRIKGFEGKTVGIYRLANMHILYNEICYLLLQMMHNENPECICEKVLPAGPSQTVPGLCSSPIRPHAQVNIIWLYILIGSIHFIYRRRDHVRKYHTWTIVDNVYRQLIRVRDIVEPRPKRSSVSGTKRVKVLQSDLN